MEASELERVTRWPATQPPSTSTLAPRSSLSSIWSELPPLAIFSVGYFVACNYSKFFTVSSAAPLWFPDAVLLSALLLTPRKRWFWYLLLGLPIRLTHFGVNAPTWFLAATYVNDCLKAFVSAYVLQRGAAGAVRLNTLRQFGIYFAVAGVAAPALSAVLGAGTRVAMGYSFWPS